MKLSEIKGDRCLDVIAEVVAPAYAIATDPAVSSAFRREECPEGEDPRSFMAGRLAKALPALLGDHKGDVIAVLAAIAGKTAEEYAAGLTMASLIRDTYDVMTDEALLAFLAPSARAGEQERSTPAA